MMHKGRIDNMNMHNLYATERGWKMHVNGKLNSELRLADACVLNSVSRQRLRQFQHVQGSKHALTRRTTELSDFTQGDTPTQHRVHVRAESNDVLIPIKGLFQTEQRELRQCP